MPKPILIVVDNAPIASELRTAFSTSLEFLRDQYLVLPLHRTDAGENFFKVMDGSSLSAQDEEDLNLILGI